MIRGAQFGTTVWESIHRARRRDEAAARELVAKYRGPIMMFIQKLGIRPEDAEDLAQDVFMRVFTGGLLENADPRRGKFRTLLIGVATNVVREWLRSRSTEKRGGDRRSVSLDELDVETVVCPEDRFGRAWFAHLIFLALKRLKEENPNNPAVVALDLFVTQDLDYRGIARRLGCSVGAVSGYLHRARLKLYDCLKKEIAEYALTEADFKEDFQQATEFLKGSS